MSDIEDEDMIVHDDDDEEHSSGSSNSAASDSSSSEEENEFEWDADEDPQPKKKLKLGIQKEKTTDSNNNNDSTFQPRSLSSEGMELINNQGVLIAKILSYIIQDFKQLADLRLVSKEWNANVRPHVFRGEFGFRKICRQSPKYDDNHYFHDLVETTECTSAGSYYEPDDFDFEFFVSPNVSARAILFCKQVNYRKKAKCIIQKTSAKEYDFLKDDASRFAKYCQRITTAKSNSFDDDTDVKTLVDDAIRDGLFLCLQDLQQAKIDGDAFDMVQRSDPSCPVIVNLKLHKGHELEVIEVDDDDGSKVAYLKVIIDKDLEDEDPYDMEGYICEKKENAFPFVKDYDNPALEREESRIYPTFVAYNVKEDKDGGLTCQVPFALNINHGLFNEIYSWSHDSLWSKCQEQDVREGVAIADDFVPKALHDSLMKQIDDVVKSQIVDYHPHSDNIVRDIVHPALYSYVKDVSPLLKSEEEIKALSYDPSIAEGGRIELEATDYWGRKYEASAKYQWLPTYFDIAVDGSCTICDYINNLVPRSEHEELYESLAQLFSQALPLIESVYGYCRVVKENHIRQGQPDEYLDSTFDTTVPPIEERPASLRGKELQVVTKIVDYELGPGQYYKGVWHVEGMSHEEIVATAIYFIDRDDEIEGGNILFRRAFHKLEAEIISGKVGPDRPPALDDNVLRGMVPLGQVETLPGRLLVFPNSHVHQVTGLTNSSAEEESDNNSSAEKDSDNNPISTEKDSEKKKKRRIIVFFLINPERRIVSTREVPVQQEHAGGTMKRSDALDHRLKLMEERKYTKQDWNVREIELCEH